MKPYTYLLKCIPTNQYYYGVRYSKNCHPSDIWKTYYTSSLYIKQLVKQYGKDSFLYEVRKVFKSSTAARRWEQKVLTRLNAASRLDFINKSNCVCPTGQNRIWVTDGCNNKFIDILDNIPAGWREGRSFSDTTKNKISQIRKTQKIINRPSHTDKQKAQWSEQRSGRINGRDSSKEVNINGITYRTINDATKATGISRYIIVNHYLNEIRIQP